MTDTDKKILIIDDDPLIRELLRDFLQRRHFNVIEADNGQSGIHVFRKQQPAVVLCDLCLPDIHGFEVMETLLREAPDIPLIVISGVGELDDAVKALKMGAVDYFAKPINNLEVLKHTIEQALDHACLRRKNRDYQAELELANEKLQTNLQQLREDEEAGRRLQMRLLPPEKQTFGNCQFSHRQWPSLYLSGDFVDYFRIDEDHLGFYMADAAGHGLSPAFATVLLKSYMNRYLELLRQDKNHGILDPAKIFIRLNRNVLNSQMGKHLTMFYGIIRLSDSTLHFCNAGQFPYPLLVNDGNARYLESKNKPIGMFEFAEYRNQILQLPERFMLALLSDGIFEILPQQQIADKLNHLVELLADTNATISGLSKSIGLNAHDVLPDDVTVLLIKRGC